MKGFNTAFFIAAIATVPELRYAGGGTAILELTLAGRSPVVTREGDIRQLAFYQRAKCFGKFAEALAERLSQGEVVAIDGRLDYRLWEDENKGPKSSTELVIDSVNTLIASGFTLTDDAKGQPVLEEGVNEITLAGNLTKDAEMRYTPSGDAVASFAVAVNEGYGVKERTGFYRVEAWRELAETYAGLTKGAGIIVRGRVNNDSFEGREGRVFTTILEATRLYAVTGRGGAHQASASPPAKGEAFRLETDLPF